MMEDPTSLQNWSEQNTAQLEQLTLLIRGDLTELQRCILVALVTQDVHARDIVDTLKDTNVSTIYDFTWQ